MSEDFSLEKSKWWNQTGIERASAWVRNDAESMAAYTTTLCNFDHEADVGKSIDEAETALSEALLAVKTAKRTYARRKLKVA